MNWYSLAYVSRANAGLSSVDLDRLAVQCRARNQRRLITGYLCYHDAVFFGYLEGGQAAITRLMACISNDPCHCVQQVWALGEQPYRLFPDWRMCHVTDHLIASERIEASVLRLRQLVDTASDQVPNQVPGQADEPPCDLLAGIEVLASQQASPLMARQSAQPAEHQAG